MVYHTHVLLQLLLGVFRPVQIKSVHCKRVTVKRAYAGQHARYIYFLCTIYHASFALKKEKRSQLRKGMVLVENKLLAKAVWEFEAEVVVLYHRYTHIIYIHILICTQHNHQEQLPTRYSLHVRATGGQNCQFRY